MDWDKDFIDQVFQYKMLIRPEQAGFFDRLPKIPKESILGRLKAGHTYFLPKK